MLGIPSENNLLKQGKFRELNEMIKHDVVLPIVNNSVIYAESL